MAKVDLGDWLEHWNRVGRYHSRLEDICRGVPIERAATAADDVMAFFLFCFHLRDALVHGGADATQVDTFIKSSPALALCRDLAIAVKHLEIRKPHLPTSYLATAAVQSVLMSGKPPPCEPRPGEQWVVRTDTGNKDLFELADQCIEAWRMYITLSLPDPPVAGAF